MTLLEQVRASNEPAAVLAKRYGISERTVYRYKAGDVKEDRDSQAARVNQVAQDVLAVVNEHRGNRRAIMERLRARGFDRCRVAYYRRMLIDRGQVAHDDWPTREHVGNHHWRLLKAMVKAGASANQIARCFNVGVYCARREIREAWALIELEAK
jgi:hypothetical protein